MAIIFIKHTSLQKGLTVIQCNMGISEQCQVFKLLLLFTAFQFSTWHQPMQPLLKTIYHLPPHQQQVIKCVPVGVLEIQQQIQTMKDLLDQLISSEVNTATAIVDIDTLTN